MWEKRYFKERVNAIAAIMKFSGKTEEEFEEEFLEKLEKVYAMKDKAPSRIKRHIETLVDDVDLYTNCFLNPLILKTQQSRRRVLLPDKSEKDEKTV